MALSSRPVAHRRRGARVAAATAREARREGKGLSTVFVGVEWGAKKREEERCELHAATGAPQALAEPGGSGHARHGQDREGKEGASAVACCERRGTSTGARGRLEVVGGRGVNGRLLCLAL